MANNNETTEIVEPQDNSTDYIATIQELKANTVPKEKYTEALAENRRLITALANGETITNGENAPSVSVADLRKELFTTDGNLSNLEFVEKSLQLREALMNAGEPDPFLPIGARIAPTTEDIQKAADVAEVFQECIDYANGDSEVFTNELMRRTVDVMPARRPGRR